MFCSLTKMCLLRRGEVFSFDNLRSKSYIFGSILCPACLKGDVNAAISETLGLDFNPRKPWQAAAFGTAPPPPSNAVIL